MDIYAEGRGIEKRMVISFNLFVLVLRQASLSSDHHNDDSNLKTKTQEALTRMDPILFLVQFYVRLQFAAQGLRLYIVAAFALFVVFAPIAG